MGNHRVTAQTAQRLGVAKSHIHSTSRGIVYTVVTSQQINKEEW